MTWDRVETMFILGDQYQGSGVDYKTSCALVREKCVCDGSVFQLRVVSVGGCELSLVHRQTPTECDFRQFLRDYHIESTSTLPAVFLQGVCSYNDVPEQQVDDIRSSRVRAVRFILQNPVYGISRT